MDKGESGTLPWRPQDFINSMAIKIASELVEVIKKLDGWGTLTWEYAGYSRIVVERTSEGIQTRFETREPDIPKIPDSEFIG